MAGERSEKKAEGQHECEELDLPVALQRLLRPEQMRQTPRKTGHLEPERRKKRRINVLLCAAGWNQHDDE